MKARVYLETSVVSYLAARPSRDLIVAAHQQLGQTWWSVRHEWEVVISASVIAEASAGDQDAAGRRLALLDGLPVLHLDDAAILLAERLLAEAALPVQAKEDALHIAIAAAHGVDYLPTWTSFMSTNWMSVQCSGNSGPLPPTARLT